MDYSTNKPARPKCHMGKEELVDIVDWSYREWIVKVQVNFINWLIGINSIIQVLSRDNAGGVRPGHLSNFQHGGKP